MKSIYNFVIFVQWLSNLSTHVISKLPNGSSSDVADIRRPHPCKDPCFVSLIELKPPSGLRTSKNSVIMCHTMVSMSCSLDDLDVFLWNWLESGLSFSRVWVSLKWQADVSCRSNAWLPLTRNESLAFTYKRSGWSMDAGCGWDYESKSLDIKSYQVYVSERSQSCFLILYHLYPGWPVWPEEIPTDLCDMHTYLLVKDIRDMIWHDNKKARASQHHKTLGILPAHPCSSWLRQRCTCQVDIDRYYKQRLG